MEYRCPTCRAPWRQVTQCGRCGTDLSTVMQVATRAWELREAARQLLCSGTQPAEALRIARAACELQTTPQAQKLLALALLADGHVAEAHALMEVLV